MWPLDELMVAPVSEDSSAGGGEEVSPCKRSLLQHEMADRSASDLTTEEKNCLFELLIEFADVFAENSNDVHGSHRCCKAFQVLVSQSGSILERASKEDD